MVKKTVIMQVVHSMPVAGTEKLVYDIILSLKSNQHVFIVCCLDDIGPLGVELREKGVPVVCMHRKPGYDFSVSLKMAKLIRKYQVDIVQAQQYTPFFYSVISRIIYPRFRLVFTEHGRHFPDIDKKLRRLVNKILQKFTTKITAVCNFSKERLVSHDGFSKKRIEVIYNGLDITRFSHLQNSDEIKNSLGIHQGKIIGFVGRLHPVKNPQILIRAFAKVIKTFPETYLVIVGDGELREECMRLSSDHQLYGKIKFLGIRKDIPSLMSMFDIYVLPSLSEGASITLLESMAAGTPAICSDVGGNKEVVVEGETGFLFPSENENQLVDKLVFLLRDPDLCHQMGESAQKRVKQLFSYEQMIEQYKMMYRNIN